jgi:hypothetical protein
MSSCIVGLSASTHYRPTSRFCQASRKRRFQPKFGSIIYQSWYLLMPQGPSLPPLRVRIFDRFGGNDISLPFPEGTSALTRALAQQQHDVTTSNVFCCLASEPCSKKQNRKTIQTAAVPSSGTWFYGALTTSSTTPYCARKKARNPNLRFSSVQSYTLARSRFRTVSVGLIATQGHAAVVLFR